MVANGESRYLNFIIVIMAAGILAAVGTLAARSADLHFRSAVRPSRLHRSCTRTEKPADCDSGATGALCLNL